MLLNTVLLVIILFVINYIPYWLLVSSNRYTYLQGFIFGILFIGIWFYNIQSQVEINEQKKMDLNEKVFASTHRSKARVRRRFHNPWEYIVVNLDKIENQIEDRQNKVSWLLKILTIDSFIVTLFAIAGRKKYKSQKDFYTQKIYLYLGFTIFCFLIEILNNFYVLD